MGYTVEVQGFGAGLMLSSPDGRSVYVLSFQSRNKGIPDTAYRRYQVR